MQLRNYIYLIITGVILVTSCKKSFIIEDSPTAVEISKAIATNADMSDATNGMYSAMRQSLLFGQTIPVLGDLMADNAYISLNNSGRYLPINNFSFTASSVEASNIWTQGYYAISQANRIINSSLPEDNVNLQLRGEAYAARALIYLQLVNFYGKPYTVNSSAPGVPIVKNFSSPFTKPARNSVSEVYTQIISDLDSAYLIMPATVIPSNFHPTNSEYVAKYAAKAVQARAYLYMGDYAKALAASLLVIQNGGYALTPAASFNAYWANPAPQTGKLETTFELALNTLTNNGNGSLSTIYSANGTGELLATDELYGLYTSTDVRKNLIVPANRSSNPVLTIIKYPNNLLSTDKDDVKIIRYAEVLLIAAEGYARTNDNTNALIYLNLVAQRRDPSFPGYTTTGDATISQILRERRKELAFEGLRYFDLTRTNVAINRPVQPFGYSSVANIPVGSNSRLLPIPLSELKANPNIVPNPGY